MKEQTPNPYLAGPMRDAWAKGYAAALRDAAGISPEPKRSKPYPGLPTPMFPR